jgi:hypothetical protein
MSRRPLRRPWTPEDTELLANLLREGKNIGEIAGILNRTSGVARLYAKKMAHSEHAATQSNYRPSTARTKSEAEPIAMSELSFREYLLSRRRTFTPAGEHLTDLQRHGDFLAIQSTGDLHSFLEKHNLSQDAAVHARMIWRKYLDAKRKKLPR